MTPSAQTIGNTLPVTARASGLRVLQAWNPVYTQATLTTAVRQALCFRKD
jgi:hypothetical protein